MIEILKYFTGIYIWLIFFFYSENKKINLYSTIFHKDKNFDLLRKITLS